MKSVELECRVPGDHPALAGHFPGAPIVPGVVLLDLVYEHARSAIGFGDGATAWRRVKFLRPVQPDESIRVVIEGSAERLSFSIRTPAGDIVARGQCRHGPLA